MAKELSEIVFPGDKLSTEEEFLPSRNVYIENGMIYSSAFGKLEMNEGKLGVSSAGRDVNPMRRGMFVLGTVVGAMKSVLFVEIENFSIGNKEFIAGKDGKIVLASRMPHGRMQHGHDSRQDEPKPAELGDVVLAKIIMEDKDIFTLGIRDAEAGVVYAICDTCGAPMQLDKHGEGLYCQACKRSAYRKISKFYDNAPEIEKAMLESNTTQNDADNAR